ncbi:MAG: hypothetical protein ABSE49_19055 [Polyangiaceae bacterium]
MRRSLWLATLTATVATGVMSPSGAWADDAACIAASEGSLALRQQGKLHESLKQLAACAQASCPDEVRTECARRIDDIKNAMPTLILSAKDGSGNDLYDVKVTMDGAPLTTTLDGRPLSIDPGEHTFVFEQTGQAPVEKQLVLREGDHDRREGVVIGKPPPPVVPLPPPPPPPSFWNTQRLLSVVAGGLGVVGVGLGASWGLFAIASQNDEKRDCASVASCKNLKQANEDYTTAQRNATAANVSFTAGAALLAAGAVLWFTAPTVQVAPAVGSHGGGVVIGGGF